MKTGPADDTTGIKFSVCNLGIVTSKPEVTSLHLQRHFGFESHSADEGIGRHLLKKDGVLVEFNAGTPSGGQHIAMRFSDREQAFSYFMLLPSEMINLHEAVVKKARLEKKKKSPHGLFRFQLTSQLWMEFVWGDPILAHDS